MFVNGTVDRYSHTDSALMRSILLCIFLLGTIARSSGQEILLSPPRASVSMAMVSKAEPVYLEYDFRMDEAEIRYTVDGSIPTLKSKKYSKKIKVTKPCTIRARSFHRDFDPSEAVESVFVSRGGRLTCKDATPPNPKYAADGITELFDGHFGTVDFRQHYLGFDKGPVTITVAPLAQSEVSSVNVAFLVNQGAWIFAPVSIRVFDSSGSKVGELIAGDAVVKSSNRHAIMTVVIPNRKYQVLKIVIEPVSVIPDWHDGRGSPAWFFTDEIWIK